MDNLTHSIIGAAVGVVVQRSLPAEPDSAAQRLRHRLLLLACVLASNFPDLDLLLSPLLQQPLGYLLHHRGFTHTALLAIPQGLLLAGLLWLLWPAARTLLRASRTARRGLGLAIGLGLALHLLMDYSNSYGLHPWYPFDARWFYGDMVFIVEPLFWVLLGVPLAMLVRRPWLRYGWLLALAGVVLAFAFKAYLLWPALAALGLLGVAGAWVQRRAGEQGRAGLLLGLALSAVFLGLQAYTSQLGRQAVTAALQQLDPKAQVLDVAMTAFPSMPLCWTYASVESNPRQGYYRLRRGVLSLSPALDCPAALVGSEARQPLSPTVSEFAHVLAPLAALQTLQEQNCMAAAWLRFARLPALVLATGSLSDYRFAATPKGNFTVLETAGAGQPPGQCPSGVPQWDYPRQDLLVPRVNGIL
ncbi:metal-dependent hydrolase [Duganella qianjiadongensis]|uniref:Metal-dependent hydrolase n=1 Tax=Duganella qianjiadongensis TaxID=2692176 RepID=A0ABW9VIN9_9BURK|nr:metal-dependent hydrolase [Duganella qianjiadongensis]MYM38745.1 metal-dependent hydrolase [Duganella qianjiadongensis]